MKTKRFLSLLLSLLMAVSLFAGVTPTAQASTFADLLAKYFFDGKNTILDDVFEKSVKGPYPCGKDGKANVWYEIYEVSNPQGLKDHPFFKALAEDPEAGYIVLDDEETYYGVKIYGSGEMEDYTLKQSAPWCDKVTLDDGTEVDMDHQLILAYVEGPAEQTVGNKTVTYSGVTNVGERAFFGQDKLTAVYLGETVTSIDDRAFESTELLAAINMPNALEYLGKRAFYGCDKLTFWRAGSCSKLTEIGERAFYGNTLLATVEFPNNLKTINKLAFAWCRILGDENLSLPSSLVTIGEGAFMFDTHMGRVNEINIPRNVQTIGAYAFFCCFGIGKGQNDGLSFTSGGTAPLSIGNFAFAGCRELKTLKLDNRVNQIHTGAFAACERLETVVFGNDQNAKRVAIDSNAFTSAQSTTMNALDMVSGLLADNGNDASDYIPSVDYDEEEMQAFTDLTAMTPLRDAAFPNRPASTVKAATDATHSFPVDCVIHYPTASYNQSAYSEWLGALDSDTKWKGYETKGDWAGHFHAYELTDTRAATHTTDGYNTYTCSICKNTYTETVAKGHDFEVYNREDATCTEDGLVVYHCTREGCSYPNGFYYETIPATGHDLTNFVTTKAATCTEDGSRQGYCSFCKQYIIETIPATGHNTSLMTVVEPTCTEDGYAYGFCVDCHQTISKDDPIVLPASGSAHVWDSGKVTKQPTCVASGVRTYTCTVCGQTKTETIAATGNHTWNSGVVTKAPTCVDTGVRTYTCTVCGQTKTQTIAATGNHTWNSGVVTKAPTATTTGVRTYTCTVCSETKTEVIPATGNTTPTPSFVDVPSTAYYADAVDWAVENAITNGTDATHFSPNADCTRAQMVTFLWRAMGTPAPTSSYNPFSDVKPGTYYYDAVLWAVEEGITTGTSKTTFSPNDKVTRAQTVTFLWRMESEPSVSSANPFVDVASSTYYYKAVLWAVKNEITNGTDANHFSPNNNCTRAQIVTFLWRDLDHI